MPDSTCLLSSQLKHFPFAPSIALLTWESSFIHDTSLPLLPYPFKLTKLAFFPKWSLQSSACLYSSPSMYAPPLSSQWTQNNFSKVRLWPSTLKITKIGMLLSQDLYSLIYFRLQKTIVRLLLHLKPQGKDYFPSDLSMQSIHLSIYQSPLHVFHTCYSFAHREPQSQECFTFS